MLSQMVRIPADAFDCSFVINRCQMCQVGATDRTLASSRFSTGYAQYCIQGNRVKLPPSNIDAESHHETYSYTSSEPPPPSPDQLIGADDDILIPT